jgi:hypothetical protein
VSEPIKEIAWKALVRLHKRSMKLAAAGKDRRKIITAAGRELLGFIWAIGIKAESAAMQKMAASRSARTEAKAKAKDFPKNEKTCPIRRQKQRQNQPHRCAEVDGSLHIREV